MTDREIRIRHWVIVVIMFIGVIATIFIDYFWTKSSLEDLSGKEVKPSTVIWTMMKTGERK